MIKQIMGTFIDSCVLLDLFTDDHNWVEWSIQQLHAASLRGPLIINGIIYSEISIGFSRIEDLDSALYEIKIDIQHIPLSASFLAGKAYKSYRSRGGNKTAPLPDFFIGAHAAVLGIPLITRDPKRMIQAYPGLEIISPET